MTRSSSQRVITGAGKESGGGGGIQEDPNSIESKSYARVLDLISEGPILGTLEALDSKAPGETLDLAKVIFDGVRLVNDDGSWNFGDVSVFYRSGTQSQSHIPGFDSAENAIAVNVKVTQAAPVVRTITATNIDAVRVIMRWPAFQNVTGDGKITGTECEYAIDVQEAGGGFVQRVRRTERGKSSAVIEREHRIELKGSAPWDIRVRRISADSTSTTLSNDLYWQVYAEIIDGKFRYPQRAIVGISIDSSQFSSIPSRAYGPLYGICDFPIPSNYDPFARTYTGIWDGTLTTAWTNNPAWVFYGVLRARWGCGRRVSAQMLESLLPYLYTIGRYCDELVDDGAGGMEPRFTCNAWLADKREAWRVLDDIASCMRAMHYWGAGGAMIAQDAPSDPVARFTNANVEGGKFVREGVSRKAQFSVVIVYYQDMTDLGRRRPVRVQDPDLIAQVGFVVKEIEAAFCNSRGQAIRLGRAVLAASKLETETISFVPALEGAFVVPGNVIEIRDAKRAGVRLGGRLLSATTTAVVLDAPVTLAAGHTYTLTLVERQDQPIVRTVTTAPGTVSQLDVDVPFDAPPAPMTVWLLGSDQVNAELFRVVRRGEPEAFKFTVTALAYSPAKYDYIDNGGIVQDVPVTSIYQRPAAVTGLIAVEASYVVGNTRKLQAVFSWQASPPAMSYKVSVRRDAENPMWFYPSVPSVAIDETDPGAYTVTVWAVGMNGKTSTPASLTQTLDGIPDAPPGLQAFGLSAISATVAALSWERPSSTLVTAGGAVVVRFYPGVLASATWAAALDVASFPGSSTGGQVALQAGTYLARTMTFDGIMSDDIAYAQYGTPAGGGALAATASPPNFSVTTTSSAVTTGTCSITPGGGTPGYTYSWSRVSGSTAIGISSSTAAAVQFSASGLSVGESRVAVWRCTITDAASTPATVTVDVSVDIYRRPVNTSGSGSGGGAIP